ncbi:MULTISPECIES: hypothetical protein [Vibrio]|uniref:Uncharacterized protein n=1 Tax=Vibrio genomosp. F6 str. FF-238 TaxID=1191298 RepID=A0A1E5D498_9VIBR|nr:MULTISPECIES: hypothetical protein [Vibrio]NOH83994.1 hypothetical protein [Vibrio sp. 03-59-1]OEE77991.1 hypothetical protein A130_13855 [Vibrio genomosp. F6 str. FF-238]RBW65232.1 hypothetical protein DS893_08990 [Vibrionales bacterium C3R12]
MKKLDTENLEYKGETNGVHSWLSSTGQPYYWHPDWLNIAEDATGSHPKQPIECEKEETPTKKHAISAILKHMNTWAADKLSKNPDVEAQAIESQLNLKK